MFHFMIDGFRGFRSRFDDIKLVQEVLEEVPLGVGLQPVMPGFLLPYYNGVVPEDCGVSSFLFLRGGHFTVHTFSFRECYFADLLTRTPVDAEQLREALSAAFPCSQVKVRFAPRAPGAFQGREADPEQDFGPHVLLEIADYDGPRRMDELFDLFDGLPQRVGMTPIMRPYVLREKTAEGAPITSAMTMIAESHISLHVFEDENRAYFDLFSRSFFDYATVMGTIKADLGGTVVHEVMTPRGIDYKRLRTERADEHDRSKAWLRAMP